jgi:hypothetical protein
MEQQVMRFNVPQPGELFKFGSQNYQLYEALLERGSVTNVAMRDLFILSHTRRISDLREKLKPYCMDVKKELVGHGVFAYRLTGNRAA